MNKENAQKSAKVAWLILLVLFLFVGTVGHDPWWKSGEAYGFGIIYHFYTTHTWLIPIDAGEPFMEKPPLYYWTSLVFCKLLGEIMPLHDAARLASVFYTLITLVFVYKTAEQLFRPRENYKILAGINFMLFFGTYGVLQFSHALLTDNALLTGTAITLYGMTVLATDQSKWKKSGMWLGIGIGTAFMAKGFVIPGILGISGIALLFILPMLRTRETFLAVLVALVTASPFLLIWPCLLYQYSPDLFMTWFWDNNIGRFFGFSVAHLGAKNDRQHFLDILLIFTFPILPFACFEAWHSRRNWRTAEYSLPLMVSITGIFVLFVSASHRPPYLLPLMPSLSLLASQGFIKMKKQYYSAIGKFLSIAFTISLFIAWVNWWNMCYPHGERPLPWLADLFDNWTLLNYVPPQSQNLSVVIALLATLVWLSTLRIERDCAWNTARIWLFGAATLWAVVYSLMMPWINEKRSFRTILSRLNTYISHSPYKNSCIGNYEMGENVAPMLQYFTGLTTPMPHMTPNEHYCPIVLVFAEMKTPTQIDPRWNLIWKDSGFHDVKGMELRLYEGK